MEIDMKKLYELLDSQARVMVGTLCKRVEVLSEDSNFSPDLYKKLSKELVYEYHRNLKKLITTMFEIGKVNFTSKEDK